MDQVLQSFVTLGLGVEKFFFLLEKVDVTAVDAEGAVGIDAVELYHIGGDVLEKVAVVADYDAGELGGSEYVFEPSDAGEIEMVGGLI
jgi:hypothetical protein